jgi:hypothetical protein
MKALKKSIEGFKGIKTSTIANSKILQGLMSKYEELNLKAYSDNDDEAFVFNSPHTTTPMREQMDNMIDS